jgi:hypothetical protein
MLVSRHLNGELNVSQTLKNEHRRIRGRLEHQRFHAFSGCRAPVGSAVFADLLSLNKATIVGGSMKVALFILVLFAWHPAFADSKSNADTSVCVDNSGAPKPGNNCVCYMKKTVCGDGVSTCAEHVCEQISCVANKDCSAFAGKCVDGYCKK